MSKIIIVGVLDKKGSTNIQQAIAFKKRGYDIIPINYRTIINKYGMQFFEKLLIDTIKSNNPDFVIFSKCTGINPSLITECNKYSKSFYWFMDSYKVASSIPDIKQYAKNATYVSCTSINTVEWFKSNGINNCHHILEGFNESIYKPVDVDEKYIADISFIGSRTKERDIYKDILEKNGYIVKFYGPGYTNEFVTGLEFSKICSSSKFMLSINTYNNIPNYFSDRLILYAGCGSCILHLDTTETILKWFNDNEVIYFKSKDELLNKIKTISDTESFRRKCRNRALSQYTWDYAIQMILDIAKQKKILFMCPGGQEKGKSPSELLAKKVNEISCYDIDYYNREFDDINTIDVSKYDLLWGDMDGGSVLQIISDMSIKYNIPCYLHGEWIPK